MVQRFPTLSLNISPIYGLILAPKFGTRFHDLIVLATAAPKIDLSLLQIFSTVQENMQKYFRRLV